ncbi:MAG: hypothetical protein KA200_01915 [Burkholderiales bacterium]|nr:hypothetical protein [Burkholderiales bacterium]
MAEDERALDQIIAERAEDEWRRAEAYRLALSRHPSCMDPDHPGCEQCDEEIA